MDSLNGHKAAEHGDYSEDNISLLISKIKVPQNKEKRNRCWTRFSVFPLSLHVLRLLSVVSLATFNFT